MEENWRIRTYLPLILGILIGTCLNDCSRDNYVKGQFELINKRISQIEERLDKNYSHMIRLENQKSQEEGRAEPSSLELENPDYK